MSKLHPMRIVVPELPWHKEDDKHATRNEMGTKRSENSEEAARSQNIGSGRIRDSESKEEAS